MFASTQKNPLKTLFESEKSTKMQLFSDDEGLQNQRIKEKLIRLKQILSILEKDALESRFISFKKKSDNQKKETKQNNQERQQKNLKKCPPLNLDSMIKGKKQHNSRCHTQGQFYLKHYHPHQGSQTDQSYSGVSFNQYNLKKYLQTQQSLPKSSSQYDLTQG